jgi:hypothetical protein
VGELTSLFALPSFPEARAGTGHLRSVAEVRCRVLGPRRTARETRDGFGFECDKCGEEWTPPRLDRGSEPRDFRESFELAKEAGWRAVKVKSRSGKEDWEHRCSECRS